MFKKILLSFLASLVLFQSLAAYSPVQAQSDQWYDTNILTWYTKVYDTRTSQPQEIFGERYTAAQVQWVLYSLIVIPMNMMFSSDFTGCVLTNMQSGADIYPCMLLPGFINFFIKLINVMRSLVPIASVTNDGTNQTLSNNNRNIFISQVFADKEFSGVTYFKNVIRKATLVPEVHAQQGYGYGALSVLRPLWTKTRDFAYGLLIFAAIIMAFMIMFRTRISPQTVITVQSAIPKLVMGIVLITFSYAVAGLLLDLMYVAIAIAATVLGSGTPGATETLYSIMVDGPGGGGIFSMLIVYSFLFPFLLFAALGGSGSTLWSFFWSHPFLAIAMIIGFGILFIIILFAFIRIVIMIIKALVSIYLLTIFAPLYILGGTVTSALSFGSWMKDLAANLAVFPAIGILLVFSLLFLNTAVGIIGLGNFPPPVGGADGYLQTLFNLLGTPQIIDIGGANGWTPPLLGFGSNNGALVILLTSLGVILLIPKTADVIKSFMSGRPFAYGSAIGEAVTGAATGTSALMAAPGALKQGINQRMPGFVNKIGGKIRSIGKKSE